MVFVRRNCVLTSSLHPGPARPLGLLGSRLGHHSSGHASGALKYLFRKHQNVFAKTL